MDDLEAVQPIWEQPLRAEYRGLSVHLPPPPAESFQFLLSLQLLAPTDFPVLPHLAFHPPYRVFPAILLPPHLPIPPPRAPPSSLPPLLPSTPSLSYLLCPSVSIP